MLAFRGQIAFVEFAETCVDGRLRGRDEKEESYLRFRSHRMATPCHSRQAERMRRAER